VGLGVVALRVYGFVATLQPDAHFGRILAASGDVFVAGSLAAKAGPFQRGSVRGQRWPVGDRLARRAMPDRMAAAVTRASQLSD
jgi:YnfA/UPF0060 family uncharacterized protein